MSWRVIAHGDEVWHVDAVAERRANTAAWQLVLAFRAASAVRGLGGTGRGQAFWAPYPLEATSKSALFIQAERISDVALTQVLTERRA